MEHTDTHHAVRHPALAEHRSVLGHHTNVVMVLGPVHSHKEHLHLLSLVSPRRCAAT